MPQHVTPHEGRFWDRVSVPGFALAAGYFVLVAAVFALTAATTTPSNVGLDWIPFYLLTAPLSLVRGVPGVPWTRTAATILVWAAPFVNTMAIYMIGSTLQPMWSQFMNWHKNRDH